jgi:hypothetical protein
LLTADDTSEVQQKRRFGIRKPPFYPLNYGNSDNCDCRFSTANCKQRAHELLGRDCRNETAALVLSYTGSYTAIQRLVLRQDVICREAFERALAAAFTQFARQIGRFDQRIQASSGRRYIAERI